MVVSECDEIGDFQLSWSIIILYIPIKADTTVIYHDSRAGGSVKPQAVHPMLIHCRFKAGPASQTAAQPSIDIVSAFVFAEHSIKSR